MTRQLITAAFLFALLCPCAWAEDAVPRARVTILKDGPSAELDDFASRVEQELSDAARGTTAERVALEIETIDAGFDPALLARGLERGMETDVVVAVGPRAIGALCGPEPLEHGLPHMAYRLLREDAPSTCSVTLDAYDAFVEDMEVIASLNVAENVGVFLDPAFGPASPRLRERAPEGGRITVLFPSTMDETELENLSSVWVGTILLPPDHAALDRFATRLDKTPVLSLLLDRNEAVESVAWRDRSLPLAAALLRTALLVLDGLEGLTRAPNTQMERGGQLILDMERARELGLVLPWRLLVSARLANETRGKALTVEQAVAQARAKSPELEARRAALLAARAALRAERRSLMPELNGTATASRIDADRAMPLFGQYQNTVTGGVALNQVLLDDELLNNIAQSRQAAELSAALSRASEADVASSVSNAYFDLLAAHELESVRVSDVEITRENREFALIRAESGRARRDELLRWDAELATRQELLLDARATRRGAERALSQLLALPLGNRWDVASPPLDTVPTHLARHGAGFLLDSPLVDDTLLALLEERAIERAPEIDALDAQLDARRRQLVHEKRRRWWPVLGVAASWDRRMHGGGGGASPDMGGLAFTIPDEESWSVAAQLSVPLLDSGRARAGQRRARRELEQAAAERRDAALKIGTRLRVAADALAAQWPRFALRERAARASEESFEIRRRAYRAGAASITEVLDAQGNAVRARLSAAEARHATLKALGEFERALGGIPWANAAEEGK